MNYEELNNEMLLNNFSKYEVSSIWKKLPSILLVRNGQIYSKSLQKDLTIYSYIKKPYL